MRLALISDLHHSTPSIPEGIDVVVFGGDFCCTHRNTKAIELEDSVWSRIYEPYLKSLRDRGIVTVAIPGNHDFKAASDTAYMYSLFDHFYIDGQFEVVIGKEKVIFYAFCYHLLEGFPFHLDEAGMYSKLTPLSGDLSCDILLTHSPPFGLFDKGRANYGSQAIRDFVTTIKPKVHVFGHVHESRGCGRYGETFYINCSAVTEDSKMPVGSIFFLETVHEEDGSMRRVNRILDVPVTEWSSKSNVLPTESIFRLGVIKYCW